MDLSIIIPVYNESLNIPILYNSLKSVLNKLKLKSEIIFIDDGSKDNTFNILKDLKKKDKSIRAIQFQKNFGKAAALSAGFKVSKGSIIITMDGDLQDDPIEIPRFLNLINQNYDLVVGWKFHRKDPLLKKINSKFFNLLIRVLTHVKVHDSNCGYKAYKRKVIENIYLYGEMHRYIPSLAQWKGFKITELKVTHHPRKYGESKYNSSRLIKGFFDLITTKFLITYLKKPLHFFGPLGLSLVLIGFITGIYLFYLRLLGQRIGDRPLLILTILLILLGVMFIFIGLIGEIITITTKTEDYIIKNEL